MGQSSSVLEKCPAYSDSIYALALFQGVLQLDEERTTGPSFEKTSKVTESIVKLNFCDFANILWAFSWLVNLNSTFVLFLPTTCEL